jgi:hypothetical protein
MIAIFVIGYIILSGELIEAVYVQETQNEIIAKIVNFLADCYNPNPPFKFDDRHFLRVPNRNDFKNVYEFIVQCIQPSYQVVGKLEEDVSFVA